jgi:hypothetical protein
MTEVFKENVSKRLMRALHEEKMSTAEAARKIGVMPQYLSMLKNSKLWNKVPQKTWEIVLHWINSGYSLGEYKKHLPIRITTAGELNPEAFPTQLREESAQGAPFDEKPFPAPGSDEITDVVFEEEKKPILISDVPAMIQSEIIHKFIRGNSTMVITKDDKHYYFMPYWFCDTMLEVDGVALTLYPLGNLPQDLKDAIKILRGE